MKKYIISTVITLGMLFLVTISHEGLAQTNEPVVRQSLLFSDFLKQVSDKNLTYLAEKFNVSIAEAEAVAARALNNPELTFDAAEENFGLELEYELELGGKRASRKRLAKSESELAKLAFDAFFQELRAEAADAFFESYMQEEMLKMKSSSYEYMRQLSASDSIRFMISDITENEARQSRLEAATLLNELYKQEAETRTSLLMLNQFMGESYAVINVPTGDWKKLERSFVLGDLLDKAMNNRIDLMMALKNTEVANNQYRLMRADRVLNLGLKANYERDWTGILPSRDNVTVGVTIPIQLSNFNRAEIRAAKYTIEQSKCEYEAAELQVKSEVIQSYFEYEAALKQMKLYESGGLLEDSQKVLEGIVYTYNRGETDILDVLMAQRTYNEVRVEYLEVMKAYASALINLEKVCGFWDIEF